MGCIAAKPVKAYRAPTYPTKLQVLDNVDLLKKYIPHAWLSNKELAALAGVFLCANTVGCADDGSTTPKPGRLTKDAAAIVAPVFEHGKGYDYSRGVNYGIVIYSPALLCEADALQIITEELALHGVHLTQKKVELPSVAIDVLELGQKYDWISDKTKIVIRPIERPLEMDLYDPARKIGIEFVCQDDFKPLTGGHFSGSPKSVKDVAVSVANEVRNKAKGVCFGSFYDPTPEWGAIWKGQEQDEGDRDVLRFETRQECEEGAKNLLRQQVKDFADWLKGQGVI